MLYFDKYNTYSKNHAIIYCSTGQSYYVFIPFVLSLSHKEITFIDLHCAFYSKGIVLIIQLISFNVSALI